MDTSPDRFECTQCGTQVSIDDTRCPKCGLNFYPPEDAAPAEETEQAQIRPMSLKQKRQLAVSAGILGLLLFGVTVFFYQSSIQSHLYEALLYAVLGSIVIAAGVGMWLDRKWGLLLLFVFSAIFYVHYVRLQVPKGLDEISQGNTRNGLVSLGMPVLVFAVGLWKSIEWWKRWHQSD